MTAPTFQFVTLLALLSAVPSLAHTISLSYPLGGFYRPDSFLLVHVTLSAPAPTNGNLFITYAEASGDILNFRYALPAGPTPTTHQLLLPATPDIARASFVYRDATTQRRLTGTTIAPGSITALLDNEALILAVGTPPLPPPPGRQNIIPIKPEHLPQDPLGYLPVSAVIISSDATSQLSPFQTGALLSFSKASGQAYRLPPSIAPQNATTPLDSIPAIAPAANNSAAITALYPTIAPRNSVSPSHPPLATNPVYFHIQPLTAPRTRPPADIHIQILPAGYIPLQIPPDRTLRAISIP